MSEHDQSLDTCAVCRNVLPTGTNRVYTACSHLFCVSCILKWHRLNQLDVTCPLCRKRLYDCEDTQAARHAQYEYTDNEAADELFTLSEQLEREWSAILLQAMNLTRAESVAHDYMLNVAVKSSVEHYCRINPMCEYKGATVIHTVPLSQAGVGISIHVGLSNPNSYYIIEMEADPGQYSFGQIESVVTLPGTGTHDILDQIIFRRLNCYPAQNDKTRNENGTGNASMIWSDEPELIPIYDVKSLNQYAPKFRVYA